MTTHPSMPPEITLLDSMPSPCFTLDAAGYVTSLNQRAADLVGRPREELVGCHLETEFRDIVDDGWTALCEKTLRGSHMVRIEAYNAFLGGWFHITLTPANDTLMVHLQDVTDVRRMEHLQQVTAALITPQQAQQVIEIMLTQAGTAMGAYMTALMRVTPDGDHLERVAEWGYAPELRDRFRRVPLSLNIPPAEAARLHRPVFVSGEELDRQYPESVEVRAERTRSVAALPLLVDGQLHGVLSLSFNGPRRFDEAEQHFILTMTQLCTQALDRVQSREAIERSSERLAFLGQASAILASSLKLEDTLQRLGALAVETLANWCTVFLPDAQGELQLRTAVHRDPQWVALLSRMMEQYPLSPDAPSGIIQVYRTGQAVLMPVVPQAAIEAVPDEDKRAQIQALELRSFMSVPLVAQGRTIGVMCLASSQADRAYTLEDLELAEDLARRAAATIEHARLYAVVVESEARMSGIISTVSDAVITTGEDRRILVFNAAAEAMFGLPAQEALGEPIDRFIPSRFHQQHAQHMREFGEIGVTSRSMHGGRSALPALRANGAEFPVEATISQVVVNGKRLFTAVLRDVSEQQQAEQSLRESEARFRSTFNQAAVGIAHVDVDGRWQNVNDRLCDIVGYTREELMDLTFQDITHPDDLNIDLGYVHRLLAGELRTYSMHKRYLRKDRTQVWVNLTGSLVRDEQGHPAYFIAVVEDISDIKRAEVDLRLARDELEVRVEERTAQLQELSAQLQTQVQELRRHTEEGHVLSELGEMLQACLTVEEAQRVVAKYAAQLFPSVSGTLYDFGPSKNVLEEVISWNGVSGSDTVFAPADCWGLRRGRPFRSDPLEQGLQGLRCRHVQGSGTALCVPLLAQGETVGLLHLCSHEPITARQERVAQTTAETMALALVNLRLRETLRQQSIRDALTGLFNRRYLEETFEREVRRAQRHKLPMGLIMLDVDHFKRFNDTYGHEGGDLLLQSLGSLLKANVRGEDVACRYGGEEFALLLPGADLHQTAARAEHIRQAIEELQISHVGQPLGKITASMGVAAYPVQGVQLGHLLRAADFALYAAKQEGRNRIKLSQPG
ncbi:diguanylate cyclase [Deinococcus hopiensis]|uniref:PAS domain S-box-containing protein/diguanylate cyclase (GGDEF) domain-containing protein n=1 Tax=Deinococcus hopiensis KR-140 TaxID=695939 RepID=A0A1W1UZR3_9DEIO|nr:diguanylate cyclase [Deinococcus hopiensis]SMB86589.1 PAS domain S-box-containing protein/diguanylate cyclase (GGDEF) domain-containing protein [Deinococcus hopiensis KR-140]